MLTLQGFREAILVFMIPYLVQNRFSFLSGFSSFHCRNFAIYNSYQLNINLKFAILNNIICRKYVCRKDGLQQVNYQTHNKYQENASVLLYLYFSRIFKTVEGMSPS